MSKISIVTVCFNCKELLKMTVEIVLNQDYTDLEYIIIDGNSSDGTREYLESIKDSRVKYVSELDKGIYDAMNKGVMMATGEWINFMNAGDAFASTSTLSEVFLKNEIHEETDVIYGDCICVTSICEGYGKVTRPFWMDKSIVPGKGFSHQSTFVRTRLAKKRPFNQKYRVCADFDMMWNIFKNGGKFQYLPLPIARYEVESGFSKQNLRLAYRENAKIVGVYKTLRFKIAYIHFCLKTSVHDFLSVTIRYTCPSLFNYIKKKHIER